MGIATLIDLRPSPQINMEMKMEIEMEIELDRDLDLEGEEEEEEEYYEQEDRPFLGGPAHDALLSCIEGEGEPPLELLIAAVACAGSGEVRDIPVEEMRNDSFTDLSDIRAGTQGGVLIAHLLPVMRSLTEVSCLR